MKFLFWGITILAAVGVFMFVSSQLVGPVVGTGPFRDLAQIPITPPVSSSSEAGAQSSSFQASAIETAVPQNSAPTVTQKVKKTAPPTSKPEQAEPVQAIAPAVPPAPVAKKCSYVTNQFPNYEGVILNEIAWMGTSISANNEWIELKNISGKSINLSNWQVIDKTEQIHVVVPSGTSIPAGGFALLERGDDAVPEVTAAAVYTGALSNENEGVQLVDGDCVLHDAALANPQWPAGNSDEKRTMERGSDFSWHTYLGSGSQNMLGTPFAENSVPPAPPSQSQEPPATATSSPEASSSPPAAATGQLMISEIMAGTEANSNDEFVELYNGTNAEIELTGYSLKKKSSTGSESSLVVASRLDGKKIPAGKHFLIGHEGGYSDAVASDVTWPSSYSLAYTNNAVVLYGPDNKIDEVSWSEIIKGQSYACTAISACAVQVTPNPQNISN